MRFYYFLYVLLILLINQGVIMAIEEPKYTILNKSDNIEIREYSEYIVAETIVKGKADDVSGEGFRRLAGYIGGNNYSEKSIEMTAPVNQEKVEEKGEEIEMTTPVTQEPADSGSFRISFVMPARFSMETLPRPNDKRIVLKVVPPKKVAVIRYSGTWSKSNYQENLAKLFDYIEKQNLKIAGDPVWARYNSPITPWFMRRNEIMIEIQQ